jgi:tRNA pseudouridine38-40 synthase
MSRTVRRARGAANLFAAWCVGSAYADRVLLRIDFAYDGTDFSGWAAQPGLRTVEAELSAGLTTVLRASEPVRLTVAGRTDAGVHAAGAVCHAEVDEAAYAALPGRSDRTPEAAAVTRLGGVLPNDIVVRRVRPAPDGFDARFSALRRRYRYRLCDDVTVLDPVRRRDTVVHRRPLDVDAMDAAAGKLLGLNDFAAFCKKREGATTVRTLLDYSWRRTDEGVLEATVVADAFCHSMVRALVGVVVPVGEGRREIDWPATVLAAGVRDPAVSVMPAHGLSLMEVVYPADAELAARAAEARARRGPVV